MIGNIMNPYAAFLGDRDPLQVIAETPSRIQQLVNTLGDGVDRAPAPGKWSVREIACHLADCELVFAFRLRQTLAQDYHVIQPFDQDRWASAYSAYEIGAALAVFSSIRKWNIALLSQVKPEAFAKLLRHPERGEMTFRVVVETMGGHDLNHLGQIEAIARTGFAAAEE
jgi:uncharacterized damage-inducible protein DinB